MRLVDSAINFNTPRLLFAGGIYVFWLLVAISLMLVAADWVLKPITYPVKHISFAGPFKHVDQKELETAALTNLTGSFITVDLDAAKERVEALPWVNRAWVSRRWPNAIHVRFSEQKFVARWGNGAWLNEDGVAVDLPQRGGPQNVPQLLGPSGSERQILEVHKKLQTHLSAVGLSVIQLELTARRMWRLYLSNGVELVLGRNGMEERIERFVRIYPFLVKEKRRIRRIDLRYANGLAVAWIDGRQTFSRQRSER